MIADKYELEKYLKNNPWPLRFSQELQVEYLFRFTSNLSPEKLWPHLSDTSSLNRKLGHHAMTFTERDGRLYGNGKLSGFGHEWEEIPWQWEFPADLTLSREFSSGIMSYMRAHFIIERTPENTSNITMYFGLVPSGTKGRLILIASKKRYEKKLRAVVKNLNEEINDREYSYLNPQISETETKKRIQYKQKINTEQLEKLKNEIISNGAPAPVTEALASFISKAPDDALGRMRPGEIAGKMGVNTSQLLSTMLHASRAGLLNMSWDVVCPHCRRVREHHTSLSGSGGKTSCGLCGIDFDSGSLNSLEITFSVISESRKVEKIQYCSAEPADKPHILLQIYLSPGNKYLYTLPDHETRLRFREHGKKNYGLLDIKQGATPKALYWDDIGLNRIIETAPGSTVFITNTDSYEKGFIIEKNAADRDALRPSDLFGLQEFRDLFPSEAVARNHSIDIGTQNIMFIGIAGLTEFNNEHGDKKTFNILKQYFSMIHDAAGMHDGALVKTTDDSAVLTFQRPMNAVKAGIKLLKTFSGSEDRPLMVKISLHRGNCIAVNLNSPIDYFGQAVNIAAKLQSITGSGEMTLSESFASEHTVDRYLNEKGYTKNFADAVITGTGSIRYLKIKVKR